MRLRKDKGKLKFRKHKGSITFEERLDVYWHRNKKNLDAKDLIHLVLTLNHQPLRKKLLIHFLTIENLNFDDFYRMLDAAKDIFIDNKKLKAKFLKECFEISSEHNLEELGESGEVEAIKELRRRTEEKAISSRRATQAWIRLFQLTTGEKPKIEIWKILKKLNPCNEDLKYLLDLPGMYAFPKITSEIEKLLRKSSEHKQKRTVKRIKELVSDINKQKK